MNTDAASQITVSGLPVRIVRKDIKNLHLGVYPPNGKVRVAAPLAVSDEAVRRAVIGKLRWIRRQCARFEGQARQSPREYVSGESHFFLGRRYRLRLVRSPGRARVVLPNHKRLELHVPAQFTVQQRHRAIQEWYRQELRALIPPLMEKWQERLGVGPSEWGIRKMKTRWGSCKPESSKVWLNLELAKKPVQCLEYIIAHELTHLLERNHNDRFISILNQHMPGWRTHRDLLNSEPLAHEEWRY